MNTVTRLLNAALARAERIMDEADKEATLGELQAAARNYDNFDEPDWSQLQWG